MSSTAAQDESTKGLQQPSDIDDTSDYFADVETSSCGSSDHDIVWTNMSENKAAWKCPRGSPILQGILDNSLPFRAVIWGEGSGIFIIARAIMNLTPALFCRKIEESRTKQNLAISPATLNFNDSPGLYSYQ